MQQPDAFVTKIIQFFDTLNVRFGVMLVGPTGGGKTTCAQALQRALTRLRQVKRSKDDRFQVLPLIFSTSCQDNKTTVATTIMLTNTIIDYTREIPSNS